LRFLARFVTPEIERTALLASAKSLAKPLGVEVKNPKWTSYGALEVDLFSPSKADLDIFLSVMGPLAELEFIHDLSVAPVHKTEAELFSEARALFNEERYWECHEVLEGLWRQKQGDERRFLQGLILVCAAFVHHQKGEGKVALGVLERASRQLDFPAAAYGGFAVAAMKENAAGILATKRFKDFRV
jgi:uncharacterized protein